MTAGGRSAPSDVGLVPGGTAAPENLPPDVFRAALATILDGRRLDMGRLAADLGISRATLYRRVQDRDELLGEVVWFLVRQAVVPALESIDDLQGAERIAEGALRFIALVREPAPPFRRLVDEEPAAALRVLASKEGPIQGRLIEIVRRLVVEEREAGNLGGSVDAELVATGIVRLGESFLYGHLIAGEELDLNLLRTLIRHMLTAGEA